MKMRGKYINPHTLGLAMSLLAFTLYPLETSAKEIKSISLEEVDSAEQVVIDSDSSLEYQVFELESPFRLVLQFPDATASRKVQPLRGDKSIANVFLTDDAGAGARVEISFKGKPAYEIIEKRNRLTIQVAQSEKAGNSGKIAANLRAVKAIDRGGVTELIIQGENMDANHAAFVTNQGKTMIIDFFGASSKLAQEHMQFETNRVSGVTVGASEDRVRLVVDLLLAEKAAQQIEATSDKMVVRFGEALALKKSIGGITVESVEFRPDDRTAHLTVRTDNTDPVVNIYEKGSNLILDIKNATLADGQERTQDVSVFPGPVKQVDSYRIDEDVRIVARLRGKVGIASFQQGNILTVTMEPEDIVLARKKGAAGSGDKLVYTGQKVTFKFKDIDIRNALKLVSEMSNLNMIMGDDVSGTITMHLVEVPWDQALDLILQAKGLGKKVEGNVMRIAPLAVLREEEKSALTSQQDVRMMAPLVSEVITLNYSLVEDVKKMFDDEKKRSDSGSAAASSRVENGVVQNSDFGAGLFSPRGSYIVDKRSNSLIVTDTQESINNIKRFIKIIDKPIRQVLIESRIVEATDAFQEQLGIAWGGNFSSSRTAAGGQPAIQVGSVGSSAGPPRGFLVDLPSPQASALGGTVGVSIGAVNKILNLDLELSAAEIENLAKIISSPRVLTANGKAAVISQGFDVPFVTPASGNSPPTITFKKAELKLEVTPQIAANDNVLMEVLVANDAPTGQTVQGNPIIATKKVETSLEVKNGETVVIGGVYQKSTADNENGVPVMKEIPVLGWLFKTTDTSIRKTELLIFLTPTVVSAKGESEQLPSQERAAQ